MTGQSSVSRLSGPALREMFVAATAWLEANREQINAINVFPVPDGDTGTNMFLTMRATMEEAARCTDRSAGGMMAAIAHGALMHARGNSGVILSQVLRGAARALEGVDEVDARGLAQSFEEGSKAAYEAVTKPTEGTILTVVREVGEATNAGTNSGQLTIETLLETAVAAARDSVARTPTLLPVLAEAGVVDAGGEGLKVMLEGMLKHVRGETLEAPGTATAAIEQTWLSAVDQRHGDEASPYGYCTEVLVEGRGVDVDAMRAGILSLGDSVLVVGDDRLVRIHVHTDRPGEVLSLGTRVGQLAQVKVDNMNRQAERFVEMHDAPAASPPAAAQSLGGAVSYVAVASGAGLADVFRGMGCAQVVSGGPTMNPSTREILDAIEACPTNDVTVLPNDKNIILAAEQAATMSDKRVRVVKSRSVAQGVAAMLAVNPDDDIEETARAMEAALPSVQTIEVTRAVRTTSINGVKVEEGQAIAVVDDVLKLASSSPEDAASEALRGLAGDGTSLVTLYYGEATTAEEAGKLAEQLRGELGGHEVEVVSGGQPHYEYIISLE